MTGPAGSGSPIGLADPGRQYDVPVTEQELAGLRLRRPTRAPRLRARGVREGGLVLRAGDGDRWALALLATWRKR